MFAPDFITCRSFLSLLFPALFFVALQVVIFLGFVLLLSSGLVSPACSQEISDVPNQSEAN